MCSFSSRPIRILANPAWKNRSENPYNALLYDAVLNESPSTSVIEYSPCKTFEPFDVCHWHWPEGAWNHRCWLRSFARAFLLFFEIDYARSRGAVFIWTFHNLAPHDIRHPRLAEWCAGRLVRRIDGAIFLSAVSKSQALNKYPQLCHVESVVIQHGDYRPVLRQALENHHAKKRLGIPEMAPTVGFIGSIRPYKKLGSLIEAFRALEDPSARLLIAGRPDDSFEVLQALREAKKEPRVILRLGLLPEHELQEAVTACDLVVFPYRDPINSGSVIYALSNHRPVLVHRCESMVELAKQVIGDSVLFFNSEVSGSDIFKALLQAKTYKGEVCLTLPSWKRIAELYLDFLTSLNPRGGLIKYAKRNAKRP